MKNTSVVLGFVVAGGLVGCAPTTGSRPATSVIQEDDVKVRVDADGRSQIGAGQAVSAEAGKAP